MGHLKPKLDSFLNDWLQPYRYFKDSCFRGVKAKVMDRWIVVSEFELQSHYYVHFQTNTVWERYEPPYPPSYGLNR